MSKFLSIYMKKLHKLIEHKFGKEIWNIYLMFLSYNLFYALLIDKLYIKREFLVMSMDDLLAVKCNSTHQY